VLFLGRHTGYPAALEGALKLKELSYLHAEGYPAGELKHGPIALVEDGVPIVAVATRCHVYPKMLSNIQEVKARGARVIAVATEGDTEVGGLADHVLEELTKQGTRAEHVEGLRGGRWVLLDYVDFVVHVFHPQARSFYQLERLWDDAPELLISST